MCLPPPRRLLHQSARRPKSSRRPAKRSSSSAIRYVNSVLARAPASARLRPAHSQVTRVRAHAPRAAPKTCPFLLRMFVRDNEHHRYMLRRGNDGCGRGSPARRHRGLFPIPPPRAPPVRPSARPPVRPPARLHSCSGWRTSRLSGSQWQTSFRSTRGAAAFAIASAAAPRPPARAPNSVEGGGAATAAGYQARCDAQGAGNADQGSQP